MLSRAYSLRTLFMIVVAIAVLLGWRGYVARSFQRQDHARHVISDDSDYLVAQLTTRPARPNWLRRAIGVQEYYEIDKIRLSLGNHQQVPQSFNLLSQLREPHEAIFTGVPITDSQMMAIASWAQHLEHLGLTDTSVTHQGLKVVAGSKALRSCFIHGVGIDNQAVRVLMTCSNLEKISLVETSVTDEAFAGIDILKELQWIDLAQTSATIKCLAYFQNCPTLTQVRLPEPKDDLEGAARYALRYRFQVVFW